MKKNTTVLPVLTIAAAVLAVLSIVVFTLENQKNISNNNREYLLDNTSQMAVLVDDSVFDFIEFTDQEGKNHNTTGGVSEASDRQYYLDAMQGNFGVELIFNSHATNETLLAFYASVSYQGEIIGSLLGAYKKRQTS